MPRPKRTSSRIHIVQRCLLGLLALFILLYPLDWAVWRLRSLAGDGLGSVEVTKTIAGTMKGNHYEVFSQEITNVTCSRSLLPQSGAGSCWWLHRHPEIVTQY